MPFDRPTIGPGQEAHLLVRFVTRRATSWAPRGHIVGWEQFALPGRTRPPERIDGEGRVDVDGDLVIAGRTTVALDRTDAVLRSIRHDGEQLVTGGPRLALWRAPTDNDGLKLFLGRTDGWTEEDTKPLGRWLEWGLDDLHRHVRDVTLGTDGTVVTYASRLGVARHRSGRAHRASTNGSASSPRVRWWWTRRSSCPTRSTTWRGSAPSSRWPATSSTSSGSASGPTRPTPIAVAPRCSADGIRPSRTSSCRTWCPRSTAFISTPDGSRSNARGGPVGLLVGAIDPGALAFSASRYSADDLWRARDLTELNDRDDIVVHVDVAHRGLGTLSCGPDVLPAYRIPPGRFTWRWRLRPYDPAHDEVAALARTVQTGTEATRAASTLGS